MLAFKIVESTTTPSLPPSKSMKVVPDTVDPPAPTTTLALLMFVETFPKEFLAQAYRVFVPVDVKVYEVGTEIIQFASVPDGIVEDSVRR